jgi:hypothetical protein
MRRIKVTEFEVSDSDIARPVLVSETWPDEQTQRVILSALAGRITGDMVPKTGGAVEWSEETVAHARELEQQLRKVEHDNEALERERDRLQKERAVIEVFVRSFVNMTTSDLWLRVVCDALDRWAGEEEKE